MKSLNKLKLIRSLLTATAGALIYLSIFGLADNNFIKWWFIPSTLAGTISWAYLTALSKKPWWVYIVANIATVWIVFVALMVTPLSNAPKHYTDISAIIVLGGLGTLVFFRQILIIMPIYVLVDWYLTRNNQNSDGKI
ncbi:hypothetical protein [Bdellovibrio reynosensis]|uniref:Uncharacterized protein n=1 Tax=Bdellovibrio reynosensis TaxID=2835041 RepID=A0ABY4C7H5_9BACT|nr:hypothetical protein [Bdellovibrio reynosensis]UOF00419.1 hypothetical protein MNR06_11995 [Bdellovibrio reynosensis]